MGKKSDRRFLCIEDAVLVLLDKSIKQEEEIKELKDGQKKIKDRLHKIETVGEYG